MRILLFSSLFPSQAAPQHGVFVAERLRHMVDGGFESTVVAPVPWFPFKSPRFGRFSAFARTPRHGEVHGVSVAYPRYLSFPGIGVTTAARLMALGSEASARCMLTEDTIAIDAHYFFPDGVAACRLGESLDRPVVITARGSDINYWPQFAGPRRQILWAAERAAAIVAVSDDLRNKMIDMGMPAEKIVTVRNGVDGSKFKPIDREFRGETAGRTKTVLAVGNLVDEKDHALALSVLERLPEYYLRVAGDGPLRSSLEAAALRQLGDRVSFLGRLGRSELIAEYNAADVLLLTSLREGLPNVVLEALSCGTPVVSVDVGGVGEVLTEPVAGRLVSDRNPAALARAVEQVTTAANSQKAEISRFAQRFSWQASIERLRSLYANLQGRQEALT